MSSRLPRTRTIPRLSGNRWLLAALAAVLISPLILWDGEVDARSRGPSWNRAADRRRPVTSKRRFGGLKNNYRSGLTAAGRQYRSGHTNADANFKRAVRSKVTMLRAQRRGLAVKREAAFKKALALEKAGNKAQAEAWLNKAVNYESRGKHLTKRINRYSSGKYVNRLASRYKRRLLSTGFKPRPGYASTSTGGAGSAVPGTAPGRRARPVKPGKAAGFDYNGARKAAEQYSRTARDAMRQYHQTGDVKALQKARVAGVGRIRSRAQMFLAQSNGLRAKAKYWAQKGDKQKAQQYADKAQKYEKRARGMANAADRFEQKLNAGQLRTPKPRGTKTAQSGAGTVAGKISGGGKSSRIPGYGEAIAEYKSLKTEYRKSRQAASDAMKQYRKTGDQSALEQVFQQRYNRMQLRAMMSANRANRLYAKADAAAARGDKARAELYTKAAKKYEARTNGYAKAIEKFEQKAADGQLRIPKVGGAGGQRTARRPDDIDGPDGPDGPGGAGAGNDDMFDDGPETGGAGAAVPQAKDGERAPGVDGSKRSNTRIQGIGSRKGYRKAKAQLNNNNNLGGALQTLKQMEARGNRWGPMGLVDRFRKWRTRRKIVKRAYKAGKKAALHGDLQKAQEALGVISEIKGPNNWRIRSRAWFNRLRGRGGIEDAALTGAKRMAKNRNPEGAQILLDFARQIEIARGRQRPTRRFRRIRGTATSRIWKNLKRRAKEGNMEGFRSAMTLIHAYAQEDAMAKGKEGVARLPRRQAKKIRKLYMTAMKRSVPKALDEAKQMLKMGYPAQSPEIQGRLEYAEETINKLSKRGITVKTGLFRRNVRRKFEQVRKLWAKGMTKSQIDPPKSGFFAKWWMMGGGRRGPSFMPTPRTTAQVSADQKAQRYQQKAQAVIQQFQSGAITEEQVNQALSQIPPQVLQQMGLM